MRLRDTEKMTLEELGKELRRFIKFKYITADQFCIRMYNTKPTYNSSCRYWEGVKVALIEKQELSIELDLSKYVKFRTPSGKIVPDYGNAMEEIL